MKKKIFTLHNRGMNRDMSVSKAGETSVYENHNIRILARDNDTTLSVTNERGNKEIPLTSVVGTLIGWNVLKDHLVLFTHDADGESVTDRDRIYRVDYNQGADPEFSITLLFHGSLGFDDKYPIESVVYFESENIQKIYWVDGKNVLRMMNFMDEDMPWYDAQSDTYDNTYFDSNRQIEFGVTATIEKDNSGNSRPNGVAQYFLTYYNEHGQETGYAWVSDLVYLSPIGYGGAADDQNNNRITINLSGLDERFKGYRLYSIERTSYNGAAVAYLIADGLVHDEVVVVDDAAHRESVDTTSLLYLGSQNVTPGTLTHKDQTLFLGDLVLDTDSYLDLERTIRSTMFDGVRNEDESVWESTKIEFDYSESVDGTDIPDIPYTLAPNVYSENNQLKLTSSQVLSFKGNEKYRFGLVFQTKNGIKTRAFWIGDKVNPLYPVIDVAGGVIKRVIAKCTIPQIVINTALNADLYTVQLVIAEASDADRSIKAQGIVNPTVFNTWDRFNDRVFAMPSWLSRPRNSKYAYQHFEAIHKSDKRTGELECGYWEQTSAHPYYQLKTSSTNVPDTSADEYDGVPDYDRILFLPYLRAKNDWGQYWEFNVYFAYVKVSFLLDTQAAIDALNNYNFQTEQFEWGTGVKEIETSQEPNFILRGFRGRAFSGQDKRDNVIKAAYTAFIDMLKGPELNLPQGLIAMVSSERFTTWCNDACEHGGELRFYNIEYSDAIAVQATTDVEALWEVANYYPQDGSADSRWYNLSASRSGQPGSEQAALYKKHMMFVDENIITLDSPEISYESASIDNAEYKLRLVGLARMSNIVSDYTVDATHGLLAGQNLIQENFNTSKNYAGGILAWPLWKETGLVEEERDTEHGDSEIPSDIRKRTPDDYNKVGGVVSYWLHMFGKTGKIDGFNVAQTEENEGAGNESYLNSKVFANLNYSTETVYNQNRANDTLNEYVPQSLRCFNQTSSQYMQINVGSTRHYYDGYIDEALMMPGDWKYPILYNYGENAPVDDFESASKYLYSNQPVQLSYASNPHAVIVLPTELDTANKYYTQTVLPRMPLDPVYHFPQRSEPVGTEPGYSGALIPWLEDYEALPGIFIDNLAQTFQLQSYNPETGIGSFQLWYQDLSPIMQDPEVELRRVKTLWNKALEYFGSRKVYTIITARNNNVLTRFFVCINDFVYKAGINISVNNATVLGATVSDSLEHDFLYAEFVTSSDDPTVVDYRTVDLVDGSSVSIGSDYPYIDYAVEQNMFSFQPDASASTINNTDRYMFIGEIYKDFDAAGVIDTRYGGIAESAIQNSKFIPAGPAYNLNAMPANNIVHANQGDTYFQRWDDLRIKPLSKDDTNQVIDIVSVMLETHINLDGRTDLQRGIKEIASIDTEQFGSLNRVYTQKDNFITKHDLNDDYDYGAYRSTFTWTLEKHDMEQVDAWTHITLANTDNLDGDKGYCRALRRFQNSIIAFQDKGIAEILFNSRTQISTTNGVPIEIANSGKVDGKRYITNKYGCINKWSIVEGKSALYFVDNINKAMLAFNEGIENLSTKFGFSVWFKRHNSMSPWTPKNFENFVAYYDRVHADVYLVGDYANEPCIVYNENLGAFTSFFDYRAVPMMVNVEDKFVSFRKHKLWLQNEGLYCNFFEDQYDFWTTYRATPDPYGDKIWTNLEYRTDFYRTLDADGSLEANESEMIDREHYLADETFDKLLVWNEYQQTNELDITKQGIDNYPDVRKDFRIWRLDIPRAAQTEQNPYGFDRIRNPWVHIRLKKIVDVEQGENQDLAQIHDVNVIYYE